jgi:hypothetical protein
MGMTRIWILAGFLAFFAYAAYKENMAAQYVAIGTSMILYGLHTIEAKLNKLLSHASLPVGRSELP